MGQRLRLYMSHHMGGWCWHQFFSEQKVALALWKKNFQDLIKRNKSKTKNWNVAKSKHQLLHFYCSNRPALACRG